MPEEVSRRSRNTRPSWITPGIISLLDAGETEDGHLFLLMPYHEGRTLRDAMAQPIDTLLAARWIREAGEAVTRHTSTGFCTAT